MKTLIAAILAGLALTFPATAAADHENGSHVPVASYPEEPTWSPPNWGTWPVESTW